MDDQAITKVIASIPSKELFRLFLSSSIFSFAHFEILCLQINNGSSFLKSHPDKSLLNLNSCVDQWFKNCVDQ